MIESGKKERTVLCCLTTEVVKVVEPVNFYEATTVYIISDSAPDRPKAEAEFYKVFVEEAKNRIERSGNVEVRIVPADLDDYQSLLRAIISTVTAERVRCDGYVDLYLNVSSGTPEYIAAAMVATIQDKDLIAFTVKTKSKSLSPERLNELLINNGKPVGMSAEVFDPTLIMTFGPYQPSKKLVSCLKVIKELDEVKRYPSFTEIIAKMKEEGIWDYEPESKKNLTDDAQKERMYFRRNYIDPMVLNGWVSEENTKRNRYVLTRTGEAVVKVYHID